MNLLSVEGLASVTNVLDLAGVFASALLGGSIARAMDFDLFGFLVVGFVSGLGGGMLRDTLLQNGPRSHSSTRSTCRSHWPGRSSPSSCRSPRSPGTDCSPCSTRR
ncbi:TRIC cation channel family protein [Curtobacterium sp. 24E2]